MNGLWLTAGVLVMHLLMGSLIWSGTLYVGEYRPLKQFVPGRPDPGPPTIPPPPGPDPPFGFIEDIILSGEGYIIPYILLSIGCAFFDNSLCVQQSLHEIIESVFAPEWKMLMALQFIHECQKSQEAFGGFGTSAGHSHTFSSLRRNDIACGGEKLSQYLRFSVSGFIYT